MRGNGPLQPTKPEKVGLPPRLFLYSVDQIGTILDVNITKLTTWIFYEGRSIGAHNFDQMTARNIAPRDEKPEWRVSEQELIRFLKRKGFRYYDRGFLGH